LAGLENIAASSITNLYIANNTSLSTCDVQSICDYLVAPSETDTISNNAPGCNNPEEVIEECMVTVEEITPPESLSVFPNPANDRLTVQLILEKPEPIHLTVLNAAGQQMALITDDQPKAGDFRTEIDISKWPVGVYLCLVWVGQETLTQKIIKVQ
ncbi:MAG: T9SS type A sorting domain-containing protein, partial [Bacteroidales bacterium]|nr:T9SS type A sorting domain-containing protein [Bacteroidales bacterium]